jgi:adenylosuccinate lyase
LAALKKRAVEHKYTPMVARSHGVHAEPTTFGLKLAGHWAEFARNRERLRIAREEIATCQISGAVGTFANVDPRVEAYVAKKLGLKPEPISTQIIPRDRHAAFFMALALIAAAVERFATELRHLQRTELREASEYFAEGQKGSSAMPHKRNPVLSENLTGLARVIRSAVIPALENVVTWHERDISHSSVERFIAPDATTTLDFALARLTGVIDRMIVDPERMRASLESLGGLVDSQRFLLALTQAGMSREDAYRLVQQHAMSAWHGDVRFADLLKGDPEIGRYLTREAIDASFDTAYHLKHVDTIFRRVFGE